MTLNRINSNGLSDAIIDNHMMINWHTHLGRQGLPMSFTFLVIQRKLKKGSQQLYTTIKTL